MSNVKITGLSNLLKELDKRYGVEKVQKVSDKALMDGAKVFVKELKSEMEKFKDTGATIDEITLSDPETIGGVRTIKVHWKGPKGRYRIIHLNEFGTIKNPKPKGKGSIARALSNAQLSYGKAIKNAVKRGMT